MIGVLFIYSTNLCQGPRGSAVSKTDESLCPHGAYILVGGDWQNKNLKQNTGSDSAMKKNRGGRGEVTAAVWSGHPRWLSSCSLHIPCSSSVFFTYILVT